MHQNVLDLKRYKTFTLKAIKYMVKNQGSAKQVTSFACHRAGWMLTHDQDIAYDILSKYPLDTPRVMDLLNPHPELALRYLCHRTESLSKTDTTQDFCTDLALSHLNIIKQFLSSLSETDFHDLVEGRPSAQ